MISITSDVTSRIPDKMLIEVTRLYVISLETSIQMNSQEFKKSYVKQTKGNNGLTAQCQSTAK